MLARAERWLGLRVDRPVFFGSAAIIATVVPLAAIFESSFASFFGQLTTFIASYAGWFYILTVSCLLLFLLWVASGNTGKLRMGPDNSRPEYSDLAWFTMLFAAGIGTVLMFWGVAEPISHFAKPPFLGVEPHSIGAAERALDLSFYHFGLHTWTLFAMPGMAVGYFVYRKNLPLRFSSAFYPLIGERIRGPIGVGIDIMAVVGTMLGVATSLGLGTLQVSRGLDYLFGLPNTPGSQTGIIIVITLLAVCSVALGLDKGVRRLSAANIVLAIALMLFVFVVGPTVLILKGTVQGFGSYIAALPSLAFWNDAYTGSDWQQRWTIFYWAWTASWAPFVGIFVARISKGRTLREFVLGVLLAPTAFTILWFGVFGIASINVELNGTGGLAQWVEQDVAVALYKLLETLPLTQASCALALVVIVIFFTTSSDSASLVIDMLASPAGPSPARQRVFWAVMEGLVAAALLFTGGFVALQNVITTMAFPFCMILVFMAVALGRALRHETAAQEPATKAALPKAS